MPHCRKSYVIHCPTVTIISQSPTPVPVNASNDDVPGTIIFNGVSYTIGKNSIMVVDAPTVGNTGGKLNVASGHAYGPVPPGMDPTKPPTKPINVAPAASGNGGTTTGSSSTSSPGGTGVHGSGGSTSSPGDSECSSPSGEQGSDDCDDCCE